MKRLVNIIVLIIVIIVIIVVAWLLVCIYGKKVAAKLSGSTKSSSIVTTNCGKGQLGNQIYQVAAAIGVANANKCEFILPATIRGTNLDKLCVLEGVVVAPIRPQVTVKEEKEGYFSPITIPDDGRVYDLEGYFQSHLYSERCLETIRKALKPKKEHLINAQNKVKQCLESNSIGLHVRRGDYMKGEQLHQYTHCTPEYYRNAVDYLRGKHGDKCVVIVCSDDIQWCKENLDISEPVVFAETGSLYTDFAVLYQCQHSVTANSSFSVWASLLKPDNALNEVTMSNTNKDAVNNAQMPKKSRIQHHDVVAPHPWYQVKGPLAHLNSDDMYRPEWIIFDANATSVAFNSARLPQRYVHKRINLLADLAGERVDDQRPTTEPKQQQLYGEAFVISLDTAKPRYESAQNVLRRAGITSVHFTAVDKPFIASMGGRSGLKKMTLIEENDKDLDTEGTIGCGLSHNAVWAYAFRNGADRVSVFEDDIASYIGQEELDRRVEVAMGAMDEDWDILYLGKCIDKCEQYVKVSDGLYRTKRPMCTHAYIISARGMSKMLTRALYTGVDTQIIHNIEAGYLKAYVMHPSIFVQDIVSWSSTLRNYKLQVGNQNDCEYIS